MSGDMNFSNLKMNSDLNFNASSGGGGGNPIVSDSTMSGLEGVNEKSLFSAHLILSALEEVLKEPNPKIPQNMVQLIQDALLNVKGELPSNPFLFLATTDLTKEDATLVFQNNAAELGPGPSSSLIQNRNDQLSSLKNVPLESRVVIRTLISTYVKNMAKGIINIYKPVLGESSGTASTSTGTDEEGEILESLSKLNKWLENLKTSGQTLDVELEELKQHRNDELLSYENDVKEYEEVINQLLSLKVHQKQNNNAYLDYLRQENENLALRQQIALLEEEIECNPPELTDALEEQYKNLEMAVETMKTKCETKKKLIHEYEQLGEEYLELLRQFKAQEEEIETKEWVKEQLKSTGSSISAISADKSLSESFF